MFLNFYDIQCNASCKQHANPKPLNLRIVTGTGGFIVDRLFIAMLKNLTKGMSHMACFLFESSQWVVERLPVERHFYQATHQRRMTCNCLCSIKNEHFKEF